MRRLVLAVLATLAFAGSAVAQNFPTRAVTIIVPFSAGGPSDAMARILAERMKITLGESVLVENVTGAGGSIGVGRAAKSPADGGLPPYELDRLIGRRLLRPLRFEQDVALDDVELAEELAARGSVDA